MPGADDRIHSMSGGGMAPASPAPHTPRDLTDIFFDSIKATVEAFDGR